MIFYRDKKIKAQATVEISLVIGIFLLLMLGFIEIARYMHTKYILTNAAREGARVIAKVDKVSSEEEKQNLLYNTIINYSSGLASSNFKTISFKDIEKDNSEFIQIDLVYNESTITPLARLWGLVGVPMTSESSSNVFVISSSIQEKKESGTTKVCPNCGISTVSEAKYCPNCRTEL